MQNDMQFYVYHSLFNNPIVSDNSIVDLLNLFNKPVTLSEISEMVEGDFNEVVNQLIELKFINSVDFDDRFYMQSLHEDFLNQIQQGKILSRLELAVSNACNFGCNHCMHFSNNEFSNRYAPEMNMSIETAKKSIDRFVSIVKKNGNNIIRVHFGNGEPLMNWKTILFTLEYCETIKDINFMYAINTNLSLLSEDKAKVLKKYNVKISTSLDGLKNANDLIRIDSKGNGTFDVIVSKIKLLKDIDFPIDGFSITVNEKNFDLIDESIIDFGKSIDVKDISMDYDLVRTTAIPINKCVEKIIRLRRYANSLGLNFYGTWETPYRILTSNSWLEKAHAFCPAFEGNTIEFNVDYSLKVCGHTNTQIGNGDNLDLVFSKDSKYVELIKSRLPSNNLFCKGCELEGSCSGQCHVTLESSERDKELVQNMCNLMKLTTKELIKEHLKSGEYDN